MSFKKRLEEMKQQLEELDREWDRLDHTGTQVEAQQEIADEMVKISETIKFWTKVLKGTE